jgi:hypothetical protein
MCILRCLRCDKVTDAMSAFVIDMLGLSYVEPPPFDLRACYEVTILLTIFIIHQYYLCVAVPLSYEQFSDTTDAYSVYYNSR